MECEPGKSAKGIKCVSANEMQFLGHFPQKHVMPGVLIIEALAQTGAVALLCEEENKGKIVLFGGIKSAKFKKQVVPGDVLELNCEIINRRGPIGFGKACAYVDGKVAVIVGKQRLTGVTVKATDLRAGAAMIIAGLVADGTTTVEDTIYVERGYEDVVEKFAAIGADIRRVAVKEDSAVQTAG